MKTVASLLRRAAERLDPTPQPTAYVWPQNVTYVNPAGTSWTYTYTIGGAA